MEKKAGILGYLSQVFMIFGITILLIAVFCTLFGEEARSISTIFSLGSGGVAVSTMLQFLAAIAIAVLLRFIFMTDCIIKKMPLAARLIAIFIGVLAEIIGFIFAFGWLPVTEVTAWVMFIICFVLSCTISTLISVAAEKQENKKLEEALKRFKEEQ